MSAPNSVGGLIATHACSEIRWRTSPPEAPRRDTLGRHSKGGRRGGGLKIDWTKPPPRAWPMAEAALTLMPARFDTTYIGVYENLNIVIDVHPA